ncbi:MAG: carbohydrate porin [Fulvivirga sp.]|nr:carbohydrate porin [Fulvivirga sp.]
MKKLSYLIILVSASLLLAVSPAHAQRDYLSGNWGGFRDTLTKRGLTPGFVYSAMPVVNLNGGIKTGIRYIDNVDITFNANFEQLIGWRGSTAFLYILGNNGDFATELTGDVQTISNIEAYPTWKVYEAWIQQNFLNNSISILAGLYDVNSEFDVVKPGLLFLHSSYGLGAELAQSGRNGPSVFPVTSLALRLAFNIKKRVRLMAAVLDGVPGNPADPKGTHIKLSEEEGALIMAQLNINIGSRLIVKKGGNVRRAGTIRRLNIGRNFKTPDLSQLIIGGWRYTARFQTLNPEDDLMQKGNQGLYLAYQRYLLLDAAREKHITAFIRYGLAADQFNRFGSALSGGVVTQLPILAQGDMAGIAASAAFNSEGYENKAAFENQGYTRAETNIEFTYQHSLKPYIIIQPSLQYIFNPGTDPARDDALAFLLLLQIEL